ncbi:Conserved_hypothetical protein [Hexamita inflata]|uniref:Uncharacterized protein n=1 Tax=Hexamita inflata TaxID=28002 RepID=A0AA86U4C8_9EUKA|nr:Conserved hypothetical protein [Hexamita inflata]
MAQPKTKTQYNPNRKPSKKEDASKTKINKKILFGVLVLLGLTVATSIYSLVRSVKSIGSENNKAKRPSIAGLDIPREVMERVQRLKNSQDRENIIKEWAASEGITFKNKKDGSYVAIREGEEYVIRGADPDYVPDENAENEEESEADTFKETYDQEGSQEEPRHEEVEQEVEKEAVPVQDE